MGVTKLWQELEEAGEGFTHLSQCSGQTWAVDVSGWIVPARTASVATGDISPEFSMIRTVFFRALCLMKHGIKPIFVMDGRMAPQIKSQTMQDRSMRVFSSSKLTANERSGLQDMNKRCKEMLECLGLQVMDSSGEAEKTCALLSLLGIADACLTNDSDAFLYGARTVYRNLDVKKEEAEKYTLSGIEEKLNLNRQDLVVIALLSGCDYGDGVKGIGPKKVLELIAAVKKYAPDVLRRVCGWRDKMDLDSIKQERTEVTKSSHCQNCHHPGNKAGHKKSGCTFCGSTTECLAHSGRPCDCQYHTIERRTSPYLVEMNMREKAIKQEGFPNKQLVDEFLDDKETLNVSEVRISFPMLGDDLTGLVSMSNVELMKKLIPVLIHMHLYGTLQLPEASPERVLEKCTRKSVPCYLVEWQRLAFDKWTPVSVVDVEKTPKREQERNNPYLVAVPSEPFENKYPEMTRRYKESRSMKKGKGKRPGEADKSQMTMENFLKVKRELKYEKNNQQ
ncbi:flap endonuclease GEN homolog 1-like isoform X2 [Babylonia areolata]|uniref:flap endonuclease GEN homolog 1-like isoform X2 n=1 Tax=Babylonia areolata TaxID=304850 RepID=UPI003FD42A07